MEDTTWLEISINVTPAELDDLCGNLITNGVPGLVVEDEGDFLRFLEENRQYWDYVDDALLTAMKGVTRVKLYITDDEDGRTQLRRYLTGIDLPHTEARLREQDWAHSWQKYYRPMAVGQRLYIVPEWEREAPVPEERVPLYLNPGLIFGTGSHASTQLCLQGVEEHTRPGDTVLDLGCGSGILSVAALVLGAGFAIGVDIDPKAVGVAYENAALNGIDRGRYLVRAGDLLSDESLFAELTGRKYRLILANIVSDVIIPLAAPAAGMLEADGIFLCSGIIDTRSGEVALALEQSGLVILEKKEQNGWVAFVCRRA